MCHAPADLFRIEKRGYIREGYFADLVLIDPDSKWVVSPSNILYKCGWSPFEGTEFSYQVISTFINGAKIFNDGNLNSEIKISRLTFGR